jgi:integrase
MENKKATSTAVILYTSKTLKNGEHPIMIRVTKNRKRAYHSTGLSCALNLWDEKNKLPKGSHPDFDNIISIINKKKVEYSTAIINLKEKNKDFTPETLIKEVEKPQRQVTVFRYFEETIQNLKDSKKIGNAGVYQDAYSCFKKVQPIDIPFSHIDLALLNKWEVYQRKNNNGDTAISARFRTLRALFNRAIGENIVKEEYYPFAKNRHEKKKFQLSKLDLSTRKRAISKAEIKLIEAMNIEENTFDFFARQIFMFSYYGLGINFIDIANLKWENIQDGRILYKRAKTGKLFNFKLLLPSVELIEYFELQTGGKASNYIFPILNKERHKTPIQIENRLNKMIGLVNKSLKKLGEKAGIETPLTTYVARHSMAMALKTSGQPTGVISEAMGHKTAAITETYLKSFENEIIDNAMNSLT